MKNIFYCLLILLCIFSMTKTKMNYMKYINCLKNQAVIKRVGDKFLSNYKIDPVSAVLATFPTLLNETESSEAYEYCRKTSNNSFEFDSMCVLKCLNEFKNDYDYSCLSTCYY